MWKWLKTTFKKIVDWFRIKEPYFDPDTGHRIEFKERQEIKSSWSQVRVGLLSTVISTLTAAIAIAISVYTIIKSESDSKKAQDNYNRNFHEDSIWHDKEIERAEKLFQLQKTSFDAQKAYYELESAIKVEERNYNMMKDEPRVVIDKFFFSFPYVNCQFVNVGFRNALIYPRYLFCIQLDTVIRERKFGLFSLKDTGYLLHMVIDTLPTLGKTLVPNSFWMIKENVLEHELLRENKQTYFFTIYDYTDIYAKANTSTMDLFVSKFYRNIDIEIEGSNSVDIILLLKKRFIVSVNNKENSKSDRILLKLLIKYIDTYLFESSNSSNIHLGRGHISALQNLSRDSIKSKLFFSPH